VGDGADGGSTQLDSTALNLKNQGSTTTTNASQSEKSKVKKKH
jgi:hypothetical protein